MLSSLLIRGGTVVNSGGEVRADVMVRDGVIVGLGDLGDQPAAHVIDASGQYVLPGLVDAHVHVRDPGYEHKEDIGTASMAAALGGVTTMLVMPFDNPVTDRDTELLDRARYFEGKCFVDFGLQGAVGEVNCQNILSLLNAGAISLEAQMAFAPPAVGVPSLGALRRILESAQRVGGVVGVYCEDQSLVSRQQASLKQLGRNDIAAHIASCDPTGELITAFTVCAIAHQTEAAVHLRQISTSNALECATYWKRRGADISVEVTPHHLALTSDDAIAGGYSMTVLPPLRTEADAHALRQRAMDGSLDIVASDHAPHAPYEKQRGEHDIWASSSGFAGLETLLPVVIRAFGWNRLAAVARTCSQSPADRFRLGTRKGRVWPGWDGDLIVVDPKQTWVVEPNRLVTKARSSPFSGHRFEGRVTNTILRGQPIVADGMLVGQPQGVWLRPDPG